MAGDLVLARTFIEIGYKGLDQVEDTARRAIKTVENTFKSSGAMVPIKDYVDATFTIKPTKMQAMFGQMKSEFGNLGKAISGSIKPIMEYLKDNMEGTFRKGATAILDFSRAGSPLAFNTLSASVELLKSRIGSAFTPVLMEASKKIQDFSGWIKGLDPETKKTIATWTALGVAGAGLIAIFGNLTVSVLKFGYSAAVFAASNPMVTALLAIGAAAAYAWAKLAQFENKMQEIETTSKRINGGNITSSDVQSSYVGRSLEKVDDPTKRKALADKHIEIMEARKKELMASVGDYGADQDGIKGGGNNSLAMGLDTMGLLGVGKDKSLLKEQTAEFEQLTRDIAIAKQYSSAGEKGKKPEMKNPQPKDGNMLLGAMGGQGARAGSMSLDSSYSALNNLALGQNQIQQQILKEQQEANKIAMESAKKVGAIDETLKLATGT